MKVHCQRCGFKFEQNTKGRKAVVCSSCRTQRQNEWRAQQAKLEEKKKREAKEAKIEAV
jgi:uncharacterized Zn finger protein (UPF0148 family)